MFPSLAQVSGVPRIWFRIKPASCDATTFATFGSSVRFDGSLINATPYSSAFSATLLLYVSTEIGIVSFPSSFFNTGIKRRNSSASLTGTAPGLVDSAPMSMISAPCASNSSARATARSGSLNRPPSEKLSGVTFSTPIINVRSPNCNS